MLEPAGVEPTEERVYRLLVGLHGADAGTVAGELGLDRRRAESLLTSLHEKGLVSGPEQRPGGSGHFVPVAPDVALGPRLLRGQEALERARRGVTELAEEFRAGGRRRDGRQLVEVVTGVAAIRQQIRDLAYGSRREVLALCKAGHVAMPSADNDEEFEMLAKGVRYRVIYERALLEEPGMLDNVARGVRAGEAARAASALPVRLMVADGALALCPLVPSADSRFGEPTVAVVRSSALLDALIALFESQWAAASPLHVTGAGQLAGLGDGAGAPGPALAEDERYLLSLVVAGLADKAIATQLGISQRTVQRRLRDMMGRVGADTRAQLVWQAARRDWLP